MNKKWIEEIKLKIAQQGSGISMNEIIEDIKVIIRKEKEKSHKKGIQKCLDSLPSIKKIKEQMHGQMPGIKIAKIPLPNGETMGNWGEMMDGFIEEVLDEIKTNLKKLLNK